MYISDAIKFYENSLIQKEKIHTNYVNVIHVIKYWMVEYICYNWSSSLFCGGKFLWLHLGKNNFWTNDHGLWIAIYRNMRLNISGNDWIQK